MDQNRFNQLIEQFSSRRVLVVGDYFLDRYMEIDRQLSEISLETGLDAYQVVNIRASPGAAGNVAANLAALGAQVTALSVVGRDGHGYELKQELEDRGIDIQLVSGQAGFYTPTYIKPVIREPDGFQHEIERQDVKNRSRLPFEVESQVIELLYRWAPEVDGVVVVDQVQEADCGVITGRVRAEIEALAIRHPEVVFIVDSRVRIGEYRNMILKPNRMEAAATAKTVCPDYHGEVSDALILECGKRLAKLCGKPVFLTLGERGVLVIDGKSVEAVPAIPIRGTIDPVGAGDSFIAGLVLALCSNARPAEAAFIGNLVAAVTIQQIGTTGVATLQKLREIAQGVE